jgi:hypothetical protein
MDTMGAAQIGALMTHCGQKLDQNPALRQIELRRGFIDSAQWSDVH